jgi:hypothetical protein
MNEKTFKCVQCGECIVPATDVKQKDGKKSRTGCVLFHDHRYERKSPPKQPLKAGSAKKWIGRLKNALIRP